MFVFNIGAGLSVLILTLFERPSDLLFINKSIYSITDIKQILFLVEISQHSWIRREWIFLVLFLSIKIIDYIETFVKFKVVIH